MDRKQHAGGRLKGMEPHDRDDRGVEGVPEAKRELLNRAQRRRFGERRTQPAPESSTARAPGQTRQPAWFREMNARFQLNRALQKIKTRALALDPELAPIRRQLAEIAARYPTVFKLCKADRIDLLQIEGVGPAGLARLEAYLRGREVAPKWGTNG